MSVILFEIDFWQVVKCCHEIIHKVIFSVSKALSTDCTVIFKGLMIGVNCVKAESLRSNTNNAITLKWKLSG